jgi:hypothetical protein
MRFAPDQRLSVRSRRAVENILELSEKSAYYGSSIQRKERRLPHTFPNSRLTAAPGGVGSLGADRAGRAIAGKRTAIMTPRF